MLHSILAGLIRDDVIREASKATFRANCKLLLHVRQLLARARNYPGSQYLQILARISLKCGCQWYSIQLAIRSLLIVLQQDSEARGVMDIPIIWHPEPIVKVQRIVEKLPFS